ncbi:tRNA-uridine aminocarboxypropyltransferase [Pseudoalteromonas sp.]|uniref:tRNA-uridine aminocarboxypropyltransferase n=1 Tax=Pseudoalteromonas sp. TaxID=53249 RepID=UPI0035659CA6
MTRSICDKCQFVACDCICMHLQQIINQTHVVVLQHSSEVNNAKNTVRLARLMYRNLTVLIGENSNDFLYLKQLPLATTALLYPGTDSFLLDGDISDIKLTHLIVLDGTWKKANKLFFTIDILKQLRQVSFQQLPENRYHLRKANRSDSLSSLEAIAYALSCTEGLSMAPAYSALDAMMENQFKYMPAEVRARYKSE